MNIISFKCPSCTNIRPSETVKLGTWFLQLTGDDFISRVIMSDDARFQLTGHVNKHNCRYRSAMPEWFTNIQFILRKLVSLVRYDMCRNICPYFVKDDNRRTVTDCYGRFLQKMYPGIFTIRNRRSGHAWNVVSAWWDTSAHHKSDKWNALNSFPKSIDFMFWWCSLSTLIFLFEPFGFLPLEIFKEKSLY